MIITNDSHTSTVMYLIKYVEARSFHLTYEDNKPTVSTVTIARKYCLVPLT
jgi:hypothetical protein